MFSSFGKSTACLVSALIAASVAGCSSEADNLFSTRSTPDWAEDRGVTTVCMEPYISIQINSSQPTYNSVINDSVTVTMERDTDGGVVVESYNGTPVGYIVEMKEGENEVGKINETGRKIAYFDPSHTNAKAKLKDIKYDDIILVTICY